MMSSDNDGWDRLEDGVLANPLGEVPVVKFTNADERAEYEPLWKPAERYSLAERADANSKFQDIPFRSRMQLIGQFSLAEIAEMEIERAGEAILAQSLTGGTGGGA